MTNKKQNLTRFVLSAFLITLFMSVSSLSALADTHYVSTWSALYDALKIDGDTVYLSSDVTYDKSHALTVPAGVNVDLNLNGHKITAVNSSQSTNAITVKGSLTVVGNGTVTGSSNSIVCVDGGSFTMSGGTLDGTAPSSGKNPSTYGVEIKNSGSFTLLGGTLQNSKNGVRLSSTAGTFNMIGGLLKNNTVSTTSGSAISVAGGTAVVSGGTITGSAYGASVPGGTFEMSAGDNTAATVSSCTVGIKVTNAAATANISAGTINVVTNGVEVTAGTANISDDAIITSTGDKAGKYGVKVSGGTANISGGTVSNAYFGVLTNGGTVNMSGDALIENCSNGVGIQRESTNNTTGTFNMTDGTLSNNMVNSTSGSAISVSAGTAVISGGLITGSAYGISVSGGAVVMEGTDIEVPEDCVGINITGSNAEFSLSDGTVTGGKIGVHITNATFGMSGGTVSDCTTCIKISSGTANISGGSITFSESSAQTKGFDVPDGTLNFSGGTVSGAFYGILTNGGTVNMSGDAVVESCSNGIGIQKNGNNYGCFNMSGGTLDGNKTETGGSNLRIDNGSAEITGGIIKDGNNGINITGGAVTFTDGTIEGNTKGVNITGGTFELSGAPFGTGAYANGTDISLANGQTITVGGALTNNTPISVSMDEPGIFTYGLDGNGTCENFVSAIPGYDVALSSGEAALCIPETATFYKVWNSSTAQTENVEAPIIYYTAVADSDSEQTWSDGWYVLTDSAVVNGTITTNGNVNLILCDGATLTANGGIKESEGSVLNIYPGMIKESEDDEIQGTGALICSYEFGIECEQSASLFIHGGNITANGSMYAGIHFAGGSMTVYDGVVNATGSIGSAGIGSNLFSFSNNYGNVYIFGGSVTATGGMSPDGDYIGMGIGNAGYIMGIVNNTITLGEGVKLYTSDDGINWTDTTDDTSIGARYMKAGNITDPTHQTDYNIEAVSVSGNDVTVNVTKNTAGGGKLIVASYYSDGRLMAVSSADVESSGDVELTLNTSGAGKVSAFVWESFNSARPLADKYVENLITDDLSE